MCSEAREAPWNIWSQSVEETLPDIDKGLRHELRAEVLRGKDRHQIGLEGTQTAPLK
jgi:hypothetical protein